MLRWASARASSRSPVLSETESSARRTGNNIKGSAELRASSQTELFQLLAQGSAVDSQDAGGAALVAFGVVQHHAKQRFLDFAEHQVIKMSGPVTIQAGEIVAQRTLGVIAQR